VTVPSGALSSLAFRGAASTDRREVRRVVRRVDGITAGGETNASIGDTTTRGCDTC